MDGFGSSPEAPECAGHARAVIRADQAGAIVAS